MPTTTTDVQIISEDQSIWSSGDRAAIEWSEYFPIIGGDRSTFTLSNAQITQGDGRVTLDGEILNWEPAARYATLGNLDRETIIITFDMTDEDGVTTSRTIEIEAYGTPAGTGYVLPGVSDGYFGPWEFIHTSGSSASGIEDKGPSDTTISPLPENGMFQLEVITARDILRDAHQFQTMTPIDIDWDLMEGIHELAAAATAGLDNAQEQARIDAHNARVAYETAARDAELVNTIVVADAKIAGLAAAFWTADGAYQGAVGLQDLWEDARVEENIAIAARNTAQGVFNAASSAVSAAESALNSANQAFTSATRALNNFFADIGYGSLQAIIDINNTWWGDPLIPDSWISSIRSLQNNVTNARNAVNSWTNELASRRVDFSEAQADLTAARNAVTAASNDVLEAWNDFNDYLGDQTVASLQAARQAALDGYWDAENDRKAALQEMWDNGILVNQEPDAVDVTIYNAIAAGKLAEKVYYDDILEEAIGLVADAADILAGAITSTELQLQAKVEADIDAQVGLQIQFELDAGSVDSTLDYSLETLAELDEIADTFTLRNLATNTNGDSIAFDTISPNATFYAGIAYDIGAEFRILIDIFTQIAGLEIIDFPNGPNPLELVEKIQMAGWIDIIDLDTRDLEFELELPGWIGDILGVNFQFPTIETYGRASEVLAEVYTDPESFDLDRLADVLLDFADAKLDYSPEFRALLINAGADADLATNDFGSAFVTALGVFFDLLTGEGDTDGDGVVPLFVLKNEADQVDGLFHINSIADVISEVDIDNAGSLGFFVAEGSSENVVQVTVDIDQLVAVLVNLAFGVPPSSAVNPLDIGYGLSDILEKASIPDTVKSAIADFVTLELGFEAMDLDVSAGIDFSQKFALSVDDMLFDVTFEDGTTRQVKASEGGEIVFQNASELEDTNGNGQIDYEIELTPDATFFNDTQIGLNIGYALDFLKAKFEASARLPLDDIFGGLSLPGVPEEIGIELGLGPVVRMEGNLDLLSADIFEDIFEYNAGSAVVAGAFEAIAPVSTGEENFGTAQSEVLRGTVGHDTMGGRDGNDTLTGDDGHDRIGGGNGYDSIIAGAGDDTVWGGNGRDYADLGDGADIFWDNGQIGKHSHDTIMGGRGNDTINGGGGDEVINGGDGQDSIKGGIGNDQIGGGAGYDTIDAGAGNDTVWGGNGRDFVNLGDGADVFRDTGQTGQHGHDTVFGGNGNDSLFGGGGNDEAFGGAGNDLIYGGIGNDSLGGGGGYDTIFAGDGNDTVWGGNGRDQITLGNGADVFFDNNQSGRHAHDLVNGGGGNDTLFVGGGNDTLTGGADSDTFVFGAIASGDNVITDYAKGEDALEIDTALWGGGLTQSHLDAIADDSGPDLVLTFNAGTSLTFEGVTNTAGLLDDITLI